MKIFIYSYFLKSSIGRVKRIFLEAFQARITIWKISRFKILYFNVRFLLVFYNEVSCHKILTLNSIKTCLNCCLKCKFNLNSITHLKKVQTFSCLFNSSSFSCRLWNVSKDKSERNSIEIRPKGRQRDFAAPQMHYLK